MQVRDAAGWVLSDLPDPEPRVVRIGIGRSVPLPRTGPDLGAMPEQLRPSWLRRYRRRRAGPSLFFDVDLRKRQDASDDLYLEVERCSSYNCTVAWLPDTTPAAES